MKLSKMICFALLASMPFAALATRSSSIPLTAGSALPGQVVIITGDKLLEFVQYNVRCHIRMQSSGEETSSHIQVDELQGSIVEVNSHPVPANGQSLITTNDDNYLDVYDFRDFGTIQVRNLDLDNSLTVSDCIATPSTK